MIDRPVAAPLLFSSSPLLLFSSSAPSPSLLPLTPARTPLVFLFFLSIYSVLFSPLSLPSLPYSTLPLPVFVHTNACDRFRVLIVLISPSFEFSSMFSSLFYPSPSFLCIHYVIMFALPLSLHCTALHYLISLFRGHLSNVRDRRIGLRSHPAESDACVSLSVLAHYVLESGGHCRAICFRSKIKFEVHSRTEEGVRKKKG
jgi:hypothetical protein